MKAAATWSTVSLACTASATGKISSLAAGATTKVGYRGFKRYLKAVLTLNSGTSVTVGAVFILSHAAERPIA